MSKIIQKKNNKEVERVQNTFSKEQIKKINESEPFGDTPSEKVKNIIVLHINKKEVKSEK